MLKSLCNVNYKKLRNKIEKKLNEIEISKCVVEVRGSLNV